MVRKFLTVSAPLGGTPGSGVPKTLFKPLLKKSILFFLPRSLSLRPQYVLITLHTMITQQQIARLWIDSAQQVVAVDFSQRNK